MTKNATHLIQYNEIPIRRNDLPSDPLKLFSTWFSQATQQGESEPSAMTLATVNRHYEITARMVLLKSFSSDGFVFFTNYHSPKALSLGEISRAALVFWWPLCQRQIRITGDTTQLDPQSSDTYFASRDRQSQISALISHQSEIIPNRAALLEQFEAIDKQYAHQPIPRPSNWGGYILQPNTLEFWQGRPHRLHDRFEYRKTNTGWEIVQLSP